MIPKNKIMLQIPVEKSMATAWQNLVKLSGMKQGDLFTTIIADFINSARQQGGKEDGESKEQN